MTGITKPTKIKRNNTAPTTEDNRQFVFDKPESELTPKERSLMQLRAFTPEGRKLGRQKQAETMLLDKQLQRNFKRNAKAYQKVLKDIPELSAIDVIRMCIHLALQENDYETAARWAKELAEYEKPKLQRVEKVVTDKTRDLTDEELAQKLAEEGLMPKDALMKLPKVESLQ
jgi:hypothetical protein